MTFSVEEIEQFKALVFEETGPELSTAEAEKEARRLVALLAFAIRAGPE